MNYKKKSCAHKTNDEFITTTFSMKLYEIVLSQLEKKNTLIKKALDKATKSSYSYEN